MATASLPLLTLVSVSKSAMMNTQKSECCSVVLSQGRSRRIFLWRLLCLSVSLKRLVVLRKTLSSVTRLTNVETINWSPPSREPVPSLRRSRCQLNQSCLRYCSPFSCDCTEAPPPDSDSRLLDPPTPLRKSRIGQNNLVDSCLEESERTK